MMVEALEKSSIRIKIALACVSVGMVIFVVGFASAPWVRHEITVYGTNDEKLEVRISAGLWKNDSTVMKKNLISVNFHHGWFKAVQAVECLGLVLLIAAIILLLLHMFVDDYKRCCIIAAITVTLLAVMFIMIGAGVLASKATATYRTPKDIQDKFGKDATGRIVASFCVAWAMGFAIFGGLLAFVSAVTQVVELFMQL